MVFRRLMSDVPLAPGTEQRHTKVFMFIFTTPTSANRLNIDIEVAEGGPASAQGKKKISRSSAVRLQVDKVTPRAIAYAAVQVCHVLD